jgi:hypothetical protein
MTGPADYKRQLLDLYVVAARGTHAERRRSDVLPTPPVDDEGESEVASGHKGHADEEGLGEILRSAHLRNDGDERARSSRRDWSRSAVFLRVQAGPAAHSPKILTEASTPEMNVGARGMA